MLLAPIPWTALAPSERYCRKHGRRHKKLTDWARQMALQARPLRSRLCGLDPLRGPDPSRRERWLPGREVVLLGDGSFAALDFLVTLARYGLTGVTRRRLDAALYEPAPPRKPGTVGRPRTKGARLPNLADILADAGTRWVRVTVPGWYDEGDRAVEICSATAVWRHAGLPVLPIRPSPA
jgi:DDE superfamily endonuclease